MQPDAILESPGVYCLVEAKGFKAGGFQREQLARELIVALQEARGRRPLVLLVLPTAPPVLVRRYGRHSIREAVLEGLPSVLERIGEPATRVEEFSSQVDSVIAYVTWEGLCGTIDSARAEYQSPDAAEAIDSNSRLFQVRLPRLFGRSLLARDAAEPVCFRSE